MSSSSKSSATVEKLKGTSTPKSEKKAKVESPGYSVQDLRKKLYNPQWFPLVQKPREGKAKRRSQKRGTGQLAERLRSLGLCFL